MSYYSTLSEERKQIIRDRAKLHYENNKERLIELNKTWAKNNKSKTVNYKKKYKKKTKSNNKEIINNLKDKCCFCGITDKACLEFHHKNPKDKKYNVSKMVSDSYCIDSIIQEISKCDIICANCHRKHHFTSKHNTYSNKKGIYCFNIKIKSCCCKCKCSDWQCLDFHHKEPSKKIINIGAMIRDTKYSIDDLILEISKCEIICVNCHRKEHSHP